jgi:hypothetical protein
MQFKLYCHFFFYTIPADSFKNLFYTPILLFQMPPLLLIKVDFVWNFALNKYSPRAYLQSFPTTLQPTIHNDNVNQFKVGLELDKGYFTLKVKTMTLMSHFFCPQ